MYWVKGMTCIEEEASFPYGMTRQEVRYELQEATTREKCRKHQNKVGESLITTSFQVYLKSAGQWDQ